MYDSIFSNLDVCIMCEEEIMTHETLGICRNCWEEITWDEYDYDDDEDDTLM